MGSIKKDREHLTTLTTDTLRNSRNATNKNTREMTFL